MTAAEVPCQVAPAGGCTGRSSRFTPSSACAARCRSRAGRSSTHEADGSSQPDIRRQSGARHDQLGTSNPPWRVRAWRRCCRFAPDALRTRQGPVGHDPGGPNPTRRSTGVGARGRPHPGDRLGSGDIRHSSVCAPPSGSGSRADRIHTSWAVVAAPTLDRAFAMWCFTVEWGEAESVCGCLLRSGSENRGHDHDLAVRRGRSLRRGWRGCTRANALDRGERGVHADHRAALGADGPRSRCWTGHDRLGPGIWDLGPGTRGGRRYRRRTASRTRRPAQVTGMPQCRESPKPRWWHRHTSWDSGDRRRRRA
jgi:hypothetical protein